MKGQALGFCGFKPARVRYFAPIRKQKEATLTKWRKAAQRLGSKEANR